MGCTLRELDARMGMRELMFWLAAYQVEPWDLPNQLVREAMRQFEPVEPQTVDEMLGPLIRAVRATGGVVDDRREAD